MTELTIEQQGPPSDVEDDVRAIAENVDAELARAEHQGDNKWNIRLSGPVDEKDELAMEHTVELVEDVTGGTHSSIDTFLEDRERYLILIRYWS